MLAITFMAPPHAWQRVVDEENASTVWDEPFDSDKEALDAVLIVIEKDGIKSFLDGEYEMMQ